MKSTNYEFLRELKNLNSEQDENEITSLYERCSSIDSNFSARNFKVCIGTCRVAYEGVAKFYYRKKDEKSYEEFKKNNDRVMLEDLNKDEVLKGLIEEALKKYKKDFDEKYNKNNVNSKKYKNNINSKKPVISNIEGYQKAVKNIQSVGNKSIHTEEIKEPVNQGSWNCKNLFFIINLLLYDLGCDDRLITYKDYQEPSTTIFDAERENETNPKHNSQVKVVEKTERKYIKEQKKTDLCEKNGVYTVGLDFNPQKANSFTCFSPDIAKLHYMVASKSDEYALNSLKIVNFNEYMYALLREQEFERVIFIEKDKKKSYKIITYDDISRISFNEAQKFKEYFDNNEKNSANIKAFCERYKNSYSLTPKYKEVCSARFTFESKEFNSVESFDDFYNSKLEPALISNHMKTAVVISIDMLLENEFLNEKRVIKFKSTLDKSSKSVLIVTADNEFDFNQKVFNQEKTAILQRLEPNPEKNSKERESIEQLKKRLISEKRLIVADYEPHEDEIANIIIRNKLNEEQGYENIEYTKIYPLAIFIYENCKTIEETKKFLNDVYNDWSAKALKSLKSGLKDCEVVKKLGEISKSFNEYYINMFDDLKASSLTRVCCPENVKLKVPQKIWRYDKRPDRNIKSIVDDEMENFKDEAVKKYGKMFDEENRQKESPAERPHLKFKLIDRSNITKFELNDVDFNSNDYISKCTSSLLRLKTEFGMSTAFLITPDGYALTCAHSVAKDGDLENIANKKLMAYQKRGNDGWVECCEFEIINIKPQIDMALIKLKDAKDLPFLKLAEENRKIHLAERCTLLGFPEGRTSVLSYSGTIGSNAERIVAGEQGEIYYFDGNAIAGDSGGPIIAKYDGAVIGVLRGARNPGNGTGKNMANYMKPVSYFYKEFLK